MAQRDWVEWHRDYDDPGSLLSRRLELVQGHLRAELEHAPAADIRLISLCAGQGRDVIGVLAGHPRRDEVRARLVELDERNVAVARQAAQAAGLDGVEMLQADSGITDVCAGAVPAQIVVVCGIFGNITVSDIQATVTALPSLCAPGALVLWTRHRSPPDLTPAIRSWFTEAGFREEAFDVSHDGFMSVGAHRLTGEPAALTLSLMDAKSFASTTSTFKSTPRSKLDILMPSCTSNLSISASGAPFDAFCEDLRPAPLSMCCWIRFLRARSRGVLST